MGDLLHGEHSKIYIQPHNDTYWLVDPETIGQCTSLLAAKSYRGEGEQDRLVFEGDVISLPMWDDVIESTLITSGADIREGYQTMNTISRAIRDYESGITALRERIALRKDETERMCGCNSARKTFPNEIKKSGFLFA